MPPSPDPAFWLNKRRLNSLELPASHTFTPPDGWEIRLHRHRHCHCPLRPGRRAQHQRRRRRPPGRQRRGAVLHVPNLFTQSKSQAMLDPQQGE